MQHPLARLAKDAVSKFITHNEIIGPPAYLAPEFLTKKAGAFVTITKNGGLRGCIGTYSPTKENIGREVIANAIAAATDDPRFEAVKIGELGGLSYEVYILEPPEPVKSLDELDPKIFGVIVFGSMSRRSALLLPGLEGIDTIERQLDCVTQKAGIDPEKEKLVLQKFRAEKFS